MKLRRSTIIPSLLLIYLGVMSYIGRSHLLDGDRLFYFGVIGATLLCIVLLHFFLRRRERLADKRRHDTSDSKTPRR